MNEREALLKAICENPDDDTPRLVFADWLQENGDEARAEFIRAQIELARGVENARLKDREEALLATHRDEELGGDRTPGPNDCLPRASLPGPFIHLVQLAVLD
ncbi:MAG: TIGR02996 domain-containing protein [Planctomycetia bacterium]|nr:TIGR02996 domain-containing protein [Planctomycetia bacterium]